VGIAISPNHAENEPDETGEGTAKQRWNDADL
jgi:hypothetical protein